MYEQIKHIIVLALENRSFDHMLGYLPHPDPSFRGVGKLPNAPTTPNARYAIYPGPDHSHPGVMEQILGTRSPPSYPNENYAPTMSGFVSAYERIAPGHGQKIMRCFDPRMVPVLSTLALEYAVCDNYFCALPGETFPNRDFIHAGTSFGHVEVGVLAHLFDSLGNPPTVFSLLETSHKSWNIYHSGVAHSMLYAQLFIGKNRLHSHEQLLADIRSGQLASYSFVEPDYGLPGRGNSQHPAQARSREEFVDGEAFIASIYEALRATPAVFEQTMFVITYDEHGGFYDHVPAVRTYTPESKPFSIYKNGTYEFGFRLSGPRVPAVVVSPWIARNTISNKERDHSCISETVRQCFMPDVAYPLNDRAEGTDLGDVLNLDEPRRGADLPPVTPLTYAQAAALEAQIAAPPDPSDQDAILDVKFQSMWGDLHTWASGRGFPI